MALPIRGTFCKECNQSIHSEFDFLQTNISSKNLLHSINLVSDGTICTSFCPTQPNNKISTDFTPSVHVRQIYKRQWYLLLLYC